MFVSHYFFCPKCKKENTIKINEADRGQYQEYFGNEVSICCRNCYLKAKITINKVYATNNKFTLLIALLVSILLVLFMIFVLGKIKWSTFAPLLFFVSVYAYQNQQIHIFNSYRIKNNNI